MKKKTTATTSKTTGKTSTKTTTSSKPKRATTTTTKTSKSKTGVQNTANQTKTTQESAPKPMTDGDVTSTLRLSHIIRFVSKQHGIPLYASRRIVHAWMDELRQALVEGQTVRWTGVARFWIGQRAGHWFKPMVRSRTTSPTLSPNDDTKPSANHPKQWIPARDVVRCRLVQPLRREIGAGARANKTTAHNENQNQTIATTTTNANSTNTKNSVASTEEQNKDK